MKKRLLSIVLCLFLAVGLLPAAAFAAETVTISKVSISVALPEKGEHPSFTVYPGQKSYKVKAVSWHDGQTDDSLTESDVFQAGRSYRVRIDLEANVGSDYDYRFKMDNDPSSPTFGDYSGELDLDGLTATSAALGNNGRYLYITVDFPPLTEELDIFSFTIPEPAAGDPLPGIEDVTDVYAMDGYTMTLAQWYTDGKLIKDGNAVFQAGKDYEFMMVLKAKTGYFFADPLTAKVNGKAASYIQPGAEGYVQIHQTFSLPGSGTITAFTMTAEEPVVGGHPSMNFTFTGADLTVQGYPNTMWYHGLKGHINESHTFEEGGNYYVTVGVRPTDPSAAFAKDANGNPAVTVSYVGATGWIEDVKWDYYDSDNLAVSISFGNLGAQMIPAVGVTGAEAPAAGEKPNYTVKTVGSGFQINTENMNEGYCKGVRWYDVTAGTKHGKDDPFLAGHQYRLDVELERAVGWYFDLNGTKATVNGEAAAIAGTKEKAVVSCTFPKLADAKTVSAFDLTVTPPEIGKQPGYDVKIGGAGVLPASINVYNTKNGVAWEYGVRSMMASETFKSGTVYRVIVKVVPDKGWEFAKNGGKYSAVVTLNGKTPDAVEFMTDGSQATITYTFPKLGRTLESITITTPPSKTQYKAGEFFDPTGMVVTAMYDDQTTAAVKDYFFEPFDSLTVDDTSVTVSYTEGGITKTASTLVNVLPPLVLKSIAITTPPTKTQYTVGNSFDPTGMVVTATFTDGSTAAVEDYQITPNGALKLENTFVTISYTKGDVTETATQAITVKAAEKELVSIAITTPPTKTQYKAGDAFDPAGMVVTATYKDGTTAEVKGYSVTPKTLGANDKAVTVSYTEGETTVTAVQAVTVQPSGKKNPFEDIKETDYFYDAVLWAYNAKPQVTNGVDTTHFGPTSTVTRGQAVTFLWRAMGCPEPKTTVNPFADVKETEYYYKPILWAVEKGITKGTDDTHFTPMQTCSTAHILTFLYRTMGVGADGWYAEAKGWAAGAGLLNGLNIEVAPGVDCPRADVVLFLYRQLAK